MSHTHGTHVATELKPLKTSVRTKAEIVRAVEIELDPHIIVPSNTSLHDAYAHKKLGAL